MAKNSLLFEKLMKHNVKQIIKGLQSYIKNHKGTELLKQKRNVHYQMAKQKAQRHEKN